MSFGYTNRLDNPIHSTVYQLFMLRNLKTSVIGKYPEHLLGRDQYSGCGAGDAACHADTIHCRVEVGDALVVHKRCRDGHRPRDSRRTVDQDDVSSLVHEFEPTETLRKLTTGD